MVASVAGVINVLLTSPLWMICTQIMMMGRKDKDGKLKVGKVRVSRSRAARVHTHTARKALTHAHARTHARTHKNAPTLEKLGQEYTPHTEHLCCTRLYFVFSPLFSDLASVLLLPTIPHMAYMADPGCD